MTRVETIAHLRQWVTKQHDLFEWPTDACGYEQHIRFVEYRNKNWPDSSKQPAWSRARDNDFNAFILGYANMLEAEEDAAKWQQAADEGLL